MTTVADIMTKDVLWLQADEPVTLAAWTMAAEFLTGAPVRDRNGKLVGVLSNAELAQRTAPAGLTRVADLMSSSIISISRDATLPEAIRLFAERNVQRVLVTDAAGAVVGILTALDVLRGFHRSVVLDTT